MSELAGTLDAAWARLEAGPRDRAAPARHPVLATVGERGAEARILVLRGADRAAGTLTLYTDAASGKVAQIAAEPRGTLLVWDPAAQFQVRLRVTLGARPGTPAEWSALGPGARAVYGGDPGPGQPIALPQAHRPLPDPSRFTVLTARVEEIETLSLATPHARALFRRADGFAGQWLAP